MVTDLPLVPSFYKHQPAWAKTIYITGLPRSGKSTLYNVLGSCQHVEALEEPFELLSLAQKGSAFAQDSAIYAHFVDLYMSVMENQFSELVLGRNYNFRDKDKSWIFNFKTAEHVQKAHGILRRSDVLRHTAEKDFTFLIAFNDIEQSIPLITQCTPNPVIVHVKKDFREIGQEIAEKGWLSDAQLNTQANLTPAYGAIREWRGTKLYVPYFLTDENIDLFLSLDTLNRSLLYAFLQDQALEHALQHFEGKVIRVSFKQLCAQPESTLSQLMQDLNLQAVPEKTVQSINTIKAYQLQQEDTATLAINESLMQYFSSYRMDNNNE
jgi:hypothetical protein